MSEELVNVSSGDGIKLQGFIEIELVNEKEHYTRTYKNTITKGGKQFLLGHSAAQMLGMSASMRGNAMVNSGLINRYSTEKRHGITYSQGLCLTNLLLNLGDLQTGLTESSTWVNLFDSTGVISGTKVLGYASSNVSPTVNGKEGSIDYCKDEYVADGYTVCERWKYPEGVATGTIDTIAMAPAGWKAGKGLGGQRFSKCIDRVNTQQVTFTAKSSQFCPPGIAGFTSNDEILLNYNQDSVSQHKYTVSTGAITDNPTTWFVFPGDTRDIVKIGDYVYSINSSGTVTVWLASNMSQVDTFGSTSGLSIANPTNFRFVVDVSNNLWVSCMPRGGASTGKIFGKCYHNGTHFDRVTSADSYTDFSQVFTIPVGWSQYDMNFGMCGSNYVMYLRQNNYSYSTAQYSGFTHYTYTAIMFTDPANILDSIVDIIPEVFDTSVLFAAGTIYGVIDMGRYTAYSGDYDTDSMNRKIVNNSGTIDVYSGGGGCYITLNGWYCTLLSFVKLQTAITKQDTDIMYVSYGYKVV